MSWNEEKVAKLKELWGKGSTASQIAEIIGGISRNAVIGKAHRLEPYLLRSKQELLLLIKILKTLLEEKNIQD